MEGRNAEITVDLVLQARAKMCDNKVNGPQNAVVSEMIKHLLLEKICIITRCFQERCMGQMEAPSSWKIVKLVFLRKPDAEPKKGIRSYRAIALTSVFSKWYASCIILRLEQERETTNWQKLHVGGLNGISCQHFQVMAIILLQKALGMTAGQKCDPQCTWPAWTSRQPFDECEAEALGKDT